MPDACLRRGNNVEIPPEGAGACTGLLPEESFCIHLKKGTSAVCPYDSLYNSRTSVLRWLVKVAAFSSAGKLYMAYLGLLILLIVAFIALLARRLRTLRSKQPRAGLNTGRNAPLMMSCSDIRKGAPFMS